MAVNAKEKIANKIKDALTKIVILFQKKSLTLSCLLFLIGMSWLFILPTNEYIRKVYTDENALLPSSAYAYYSHQKVKYAEEQSKILRELKLKGSEYYSDHLIKELKALGMETSQQRFTIKSDDGTNDIEGINTYGILRAWKTDGTEALLLNSDWESLPSTQGNHNGVAMLLSIAHQFKQSTYWAKDIIFLFTQHNHKGLHQWLKSYHGESGVEPLDIRSGYIQIALDLDLPPSSDKYESIQMVYEGINGYLPNLDVISTLQRVGDDFRAKTSVHPNSNENEYLNRLTTMFTQLSIQATTIPAKPSGLFLAYDIHGISLVGVPSQHSTFGWVEIGIIIEEAFRSYNNLLERLHHSYNFYIMLSYSEFVSLQMYLPVVGILGAIPLIYSMLSLSKLSQKFSSLKQRSTLGFYNYRGPFLLFLVAQVSGWFSYTLLLNYSDKFNNLGIFILPLIYAIQAKLLPILYPTNSPVFLEYKLMLLMLTSIATLCLSTLNFGLALALSILTFPYVILTHLTPIKSYLGKFVSLTVLLALSPQVILLVISFAYGWDILDIMSTLRWNIVEGNAWIGSVLGLIYFPLNFGFLQSVLASNRE